jgi:hypothetical protein
MNHTTIGDWIQKYKPERLFHSKTEISEFIIDETPKIWFRSDMVMGSY